MASMITDAFWLLFGCFAFSFFPASCFQLRKLCLAKERRKKRKINLFELVIIPCDLKVNNFKDDVKRPLCQTHFTPARGTLLKRNEGQTPHSSLHMCRMRSVINCAEFTLVQKDYSVFL